MLKLITYKVKHNRKTNYHEVSSIILNMPDENHGHTEKSLDEKTIIDFIISITRQTKGVHKVILSYEEN